MKALPVLAIIGGILVLMTISFLGGVFSEHQFGLWPAQETLTPTPISRLPLDRELQIGVDSWSLPRGDPFSTPEVDTDIIRGLAENLSATHDVVILSICISFDNFDGESVLAGDYPKGEYCPDGTPIWPLPRTIRGLQVRAEDKAFWSVQVNPTGVQGHWENWSCTATWKWKGISSKLESAWQTKSCTME